MIPETRGEKLTQRLPVEFPILFPTLHIFKRSKIKLIELILESLIEVIERYDIGGGVKVDEDQTLAGSVGCYFEEPVRGFIEC
jgi:hypothetical protein